MDSQSISFVQEDPSTQESPSRRREERDDLRDEMRDNYHGKVAEMSGKPTARMTWSPRRYGKSIVLELGLVLLGWPKGLSFADPSDIRGGVPSLKMLRSLWNEGKLRFERASPEDIERARRDPLSVLPDGGRCLEERRNKRPADEPPAPLVLHPVDLHPLGHHHAGAGTLPKGRKRQQRMDVKKARFRPKKNPLRKPLRRPKLGVKSARNVLDLDDEDGTRAAGESSSSQWSAKRRRYALVDDPMHEVA